MRFWYYQLRKQVAKRRLFLPNTQNYIISYPKSWRTWLRLLIGKVLCEQFHLSEKMALNTYELTKKVGLPLTHFSHDFSSILSSFPYQYYPTDKATYQNNSILFLTRDIRDVLVSSYFQATRRTKQYNRHLSDFIRDERFGVKKIITFYNSWHVHQNIPDKFLHLTYEDLHQYPVSRLRTVLQFLDFPEIDDNILKTAVSFASFDNMKQMEQAGIFQTEKLLPADNFDPESYKVRRGVIGGYKEYLSEADLIYIEETVAEMGNPFFEQS